MTNHGNLGRDALGLASESTRARFRALPTHEAMDRRLGTIVVVPGRCAAGRDPAVIDVRAAIGPRRWMLDTLPRALPDEPHKKVRTGRVVGKVLKSAPTRLTRTGF